MPGYIGRLPWACPECHGTDVAGVGFIHHAPGCSRREFDKELARSCTICKNPIYPGDDRAFGPPPRHLDCAVELEAQLDEDHSKEWKPPKDWVTGHVVTAKDLENDAELP